MNNLKEYSDKISEEVTAVLSRVDPEQMKTFLDLIQGRAKSRFMPADAKD